MLPCGDFLSSTDSATAVAALFTRVDGTTKSSDFPSAFMSEVPSQRFADRSTPQRGDVETKGLSRFSRLECQHLWDGLRGDGLRGRSSLFCRNKLAASPYSGLIPAPLSLSNTLIDDSAIAKVHDMKRLRELRLNGTAITASCLPELKQNLSLQQLWVSASQITEEDTKDLRSALPKIEIFYDPRGR